MRTRNTAGGKPARRGTWTSTGVSLVGDDPMSLFLITMSRERGRRCTARAACGGFSSLCGIDVPLPALHECLNGCGQNFETLPESGRHFALCIAGGVPQDDALVIPRQHEARGMGIPEVNGQDPDHVPTREENFNPAILPQEAPMNAPAAEGDEAMDMPEAIEDPAGMAVAEEDIAIVVEQYAAPNARRNRKQRI
ncbi:hypothetical protein RUND412_006069 [Rhizina undulata]